MCDAASHGAIHPEPVERQRVWVPIVRIVGGVSTSDRSRFGCWEENVQGM